MAAYRQAVRLDPAFGEARENLAEVEAELRRRAGERLSARERRLQ
jgi:hypothetical protein